MQKTFEDYVFLIIGNTLSRKELANMADNKEELMAYLSVSVSLAQLLQHIVSALGDEKEREKIVSQMNSDEKPSTEHMMEILKRFSSSVRN